MRRFLIRVTDRRLTVSLFLAFLVLFCLGLVLPQRPLLSAEEAVALAERRPTLDRIVTATGLDDVYRSTIMRVVFGACVVQLIAYLALRFPPLWRESLAPTKEEPAHMPLRLVVRGSPERLRSAVQELRGRFPLEEWSSGRWFGVKNSWSGISGLVFHASLVLLLAGAWLLKVSLFRGTVVLAEGQPFGGTRAEYVSVSPPGITDEQLPPIAFTPHKIRPVFSARNRTVDVTCEAFKGKDTGALETFAVNRPLKVEGSEVLIHGFDLAPVFVVRHRETDRVVDAQCVRLAVWAEGSPEDTFELTTPAATVHARFFPDHHEGPDGHSSRGPTMKSPALYVRIESQDAYQPPVEGLLKPGDSVEFGRHQLTLEEFRTWGNYHVSRQTGWLLMVGFVVMVVSISLRFFFVRQAVAAQLVESAGGTELRIGARAAFFPESLRHRLESLVGGLMEEPPTEAPGLEESDGNL